MPVLVFVLWIAMSASAAAAGPDRVAGAPAPVKDVTPVARTADIEFVAFAFQQPALSGGRSVDFRAIDGEPSIGARYGVSATIGGQEAIATATFDVVDEHGGHIQPVAMTQRPAGASGEGEFLGMMTVPALPFRIVLNGESADGRRFTRVYRRLFTPVPAPPAVTPFGAEPGGAAGPLKNVSGEKMPQGVAERETALAGADAAIVMPHARVSNVTYAPLASSAGAPIGLRVSYQVEFSAAGRYNPGLRIFAFDAADAVAGRNPMHAIDSRVDPMPRETYEPHPVARVHAGALDQRADFLYDARTVYTFTLDLVPDYIAFERDLFTPCISRHRFERDRQAREIFARRLANESETEYRVSIGGQAFEGRIERFPGEGTLYRNFLADGGRDCEDLPASRR